MAKVEKAVKTTVTVTLDDVEWGAIQAFIEAFGGEVAADDFKCREKYARLFGYWDKADDVRIDVGVESS